MKGWIMGNFSGAALTGKKGSNTVASEISGDIRYFLRQMELRHNFMLMNV